MTRSRRGLSMLALAAAGVLVFSACSGGGGEEGGGEGGGASDAIITANNTEPQKPLTPGNTSETGGGKVINQLWEGLVYYDTEGVSQMGVAESIESDDNVTWTIKLREDAVFSDGTPVQAHNFVDAWNYTANIDNAMDAQYFFSAIEGFSETDPVEEMSGLKLVDDYTFTVTATPDFPDRLGYSAFYPLPDVAFEDMEAFGENPIGNGLYKMDGEGAWKHDASISLVKNETYVGPREAKNGGIEFTIYASLDAAYTDLLANNIDVLDQIPDTSFAVFQEELGDRAVNQAGALTTTLAISENLEHFGGEEGKLRRAALSMAIDREEIIDVIFEGTNVPAEDFTSPVVDGYAEGLEGSEKLEFNPEEAQRLWAEADEMNPYDGTLELATNTDGPHVVWVEAVANQWANNLGVTAAPKLYPTFASFLDEREADTVGGPFRAGWQGDYPGAYNYMQPLYYTNASSNHGFYSNEEFDTVLDEAAAESDKDKRNELLNQAQEILFEDMPSIPLWYQGTTGGYSENVDNVAFGWDSQPIYSDITVK